MRSHIAEIPDGVYEFSDRLDNDGVVDEPLEVRLRVEVSGGDMVVDFTGSAPASMGPMNFSRSTAISACYVALKHVFPDVPVNGGTFRPVRFVIPKGSILDAQYPRAVGGELEIIGHTLEGMFGALAQAIPARVPACSFGTTGVVTASGRRPDTHAYFVAVFPYPGGYGASAQSDGLVNGTPPQSQANFMSLEASEHRYPVRFDHFALREDSGGAGFHRGGCGTTYKFTATAELEVSVLGDRADNPPFGIAGGGPGAPNRVQLRLGGEDFVPPLRTKLERQPLRAGDSVWAQSPGGGGFGDPLTRDVQAVERDLRLGYISARTAQQVYGVVLAESGAGGGPPEVDHVATERHRLLRTSAADAS
jgi:N-methylhydantoinase B